MKPTEHSIPVASIRNPAIELRSISKRFGDCVANQNIDLKVAAGTIHGVIGENGAGKSTAMKILYGMIRPDQGEVVVHGKGVRFSSPADAIVLGIGMVHQHFMLAGPHTALDNILLGVEPRRFGIIQRKTAYSELERLARDYGIDSKLDQNIEDLPVGIQQKTEILKLLYRKANILILDEPTAVLTPQETEELFAKLRKLKQEGKTILLISHKLKEILGVTDNVTVFHAGRTIASRKTSDTTADELAELMIGRRVQFNSEIPAVRQHDEKVLEVASLGLRHVQGGHHRLEDISFSVRSGEVVGIAGVEGNGQSELLQALLHPRDPNCRTEGKVRITNTDVSQWSARRIRDLGVAVIPEDRHREGLMLQRSLAENFLLGLQRETNFSRFGFLNLLAWRKAANKAVTDYDVRPRKLSARAGQLSGGNQQKLIVAREMSRNPRLTIAAQPTRGVDVGAVEFIHQQILKTRDAGAGVLLISSELEEILKLSDRILVMFRGRIAGEFKRGQVTERELGLKMGGA